MPISNKFPALIPSLSLDFAKSRILDSRITFVRSSTATYMGPNGLITTAPANIPRFDHDPSTGKSLGLRVEESRVNLVTYSEDTTNYHFIDNATITSNTVVAPTGELTGDTLNSSISGGSNQCFVQKFASVAANTNTYTFSVFLKAGTSPRTTINMQLAGGTYQQSILEINWSTNAISYTGTSQGFVEAYPNGWFRVALTLTNNGTNNAAYPRVYTRDQGNTNVAGETVYIWGWQLETGAFPTTYIPTVASQVTRLNDLVTITGTNFSSWYNQTEGTFVVKSSKVNQVTSSFPRIFQVDDGTNANNLTVLWWTQGNQLYTASRAGDVQQVDLGLSPITQTNVNTVATGYKTNDFTISINGSNPIFDTVATLPTVSTLRFGASNFGVESSICINRFAYYPTRLTDTNIKSLSF